MWKGKYGRTRVIPTYRNGRKTSERMLCVTEFLNTETLASSSHELSFELTRREDLGKHSVHTHFLKDRNCEICQRNKTHKGPWRRRIGRVVLRAENFGDLITADHKVQSEGCESRNNHRYAIVVQDMDPMDPVISVQNKKLLRNTNDILKVLGARLETKGHLHWQFRGIRQVLRGIILETLCVNPHRSETSEIAEVQCAEWRKAPLPCCCNQISMKNGGHIPWNAMPICATFKISCLMGRLHTKDVLETKDQSFRSVYWLS